MTLGRPVWLLLIAGLASAAATWAEQKTFTEPKNMAIPDLGCVGGSILLDEGGLVTDVDVEVKVTHTFRSDLRILVEFEPFPEIATQVWAVLAGHDGGNDNYYARFDSDAADTCAAVCASGCGGQPPPSCRPDQSFDAFDGKPPRGPFLITVCDAAGGDAGTLVEWSVIVSGLSLTLDIDGDGEVDPLTDGVLTLRHHFGFTGDTLISGAVSPSCTRCSAAEIDAFLDAP